MDLNSISLIIPFEKTDDLSLKNLEFTLERVLSCKFSEIIVIQSSKEEKITLPNGVKYFRLEGSKGKMINEVVQTTQSAWLWINNPNIHCNFRYVVSKVDRRCTGLIPYNQMFFLDETESENFIEQQKIIKDKEDGFAPNMIAQGSLLIRKSEFLGIRGYNEEISEALQTIELEYRHNRTYNVFGFWQAPFPAVSLHHNQYNAFEKIPDNLQAAIEKDVYSYIQNLKSSLPHLSEMSNTEQLNKPKKIIHLINIVKDRSAIKYLIKLSSKMNVDLIALHDKKIKGLVTKKVKDHTMKSLSKITDFDKDTLILLSDSSSIPSPLLYKSLFNNEEHFCKIRQLNVSGNPTGYSEYIKNPAVLGDVCAYSARYNILKDQMFSQKTFDEIAKSITSLSGESPHEHLQGFYSSASYNECIYEPALDSDVAIIMPYNPENKEFTFESIFALSKQTYPFKLFMVESKSNKPEFGFIKSYCPQAEQLITKENNLIDEGFKAAKNFPFVVIMDTPLLPTRPDWLFSLTSKIKENPSCLVQGLETIQSNSKKLNGLVSAALGLTGSDYPTSNSCWGMSRKAYREKYQILANLTGQDIADNLENYQFIPFSLIGDLK